MNVIEFSSEQIKEFTLKFKDHLEPNNNPYIKFFFRFDGASVSIYDSNKVVFQGSNLTPFKDYIDIDIENNIDYDSLNTIGADEVGTGDSFGPVVCAACFIKASDINKFKELGIKDSKKLDDEKIKELAKILINNTNYKVSILDNLKYNEISSKYNMNEMKAILHNNNFIHLAKEVNYDKAVLDEFVSKEKYFEYLKGINSFNNIEFEMKGENKSIAVASASIIARYYFLIEMDNLNKKFNLNLPKGSSIDAIKYIHKLKEENKDNILKYIAKLNFKNFY